MASQSKSTKKKGIIFIDKYKVYYYDELHPSILQFPFQPNTIQDLEVFDKDLLANHIKTFIETNKLLPTNILFIFADSILFEKAFPISPVDNRDAEIQTFLENIPFEMVSYKVFNLGSEFRVVALNREIYLSIKAGFEKLGFSSAGAIPLFLLGDAFKTRSSLDFEMVKFALSRFDQLQKQNIVEDVTGFNINEESGKTNGNSHAQQKNKKKYEVIGLVAVAAIFFILSVIIYLQFTQKPAKKPSPVPKTIVAPTSVDIPTIEPQPTETSTPSATPTK
ncbi:hypothetical protein HY357_04545 [Candidatus Roizmanbacteria bacterium]|nr:hypothetical protein [Candidatus Roizmanbacteria bacterium]